MQLSATKRNEGARGSRIVERSELGPALRRVMAEAEIDDIHTHLYAPEFGGLLLFGIDELLTYHYLVAEVLRVATVDAESFFALSKTEQADLVWRELFVQRSPLSEAARGVITCLGALGCDPASRDLGVHRRVLGEGSPEQRVDRVLELARVRTVVMTNDPFDPAEQAVWQNAERVERLGRDERFVPALRLDRLLELDDGAVRTMRDSGYEVDRELRPKCITEIQRFVRDQIATMRPLYVAASLSPTYSLKNRIFEAVLPVLAETSLPLALMIGVQRGVNPRLGGAGDGVGLASLSDLAELCASYPEQRVLCTVLARENQHELVVLARKFRNLHVFGCWWFVNVPSLTDEITRMRIELLGHSFTPQHSDARVLEQLIYKWADTKRLLARVLEDKYGELLDAGWSVEEANLRDEVAGFMGRNAMQFLGRD